MSNNTFTTSAEFKKQARKAIGAIVLFIVSYLLILVCTVGLTLALVTAGFSIFVAKPSFLTGLLGVGMMCIGLLVLIFLLKFMFNRTKTDRSGMIEITADDEPELFEMIHEIVEKTTTDFPKRVYLTPEVNASVFYDSNFWSMFLPIRKNLMIGMGLVNTVTKDELRAILTHEFGHFSQRSMKIGSYAYNLNKIVFNMLYDNDSYKRMVSKIADLNGYLTFFVIIAVKINEGIQWILRKLYMILNRSHMGLSREMEFHADEISAKINGYQPLKTSLFRMDLADNSYDTVIGFYNEKFSENLKSTNLYRDQSEAMKIQAELNGFPIKNGFAVVTAEDQNRFNKSKLVIKNEWESHPSMVDRVARMEELNYPGPPDSGEPANSIFQQLEQWQIELTEMLFKNVEYEETPQELTSQEFAQIYQKDLSESLFPKFYNGYYDNKNPVEFDLLQNGNPTENIEDLFSDEKTDWVYTAVSLKNDLDTLSGIADKTYPVKSFEYNGIKYTRKNVPQVTNVLKNQLEQLDEKIKQNDLDIFYHFNLLERESGKSGKLRKLYREFFDFDRESDLKIAFYSELLNDYSFVNEETPFDTIKSNFDKLKPKEEKLRSELKEMLDTQETLAELSEETIRNLEKFTAESHVYFNKESYNDENLSLLFTAIDSYGFLISRKFFRMKKEILDYQYELYKEAKVLG